MAEAGSDGTSGSVAGVGEALLRLGPWLVLGYFTLHAVLRVLLGAPANLDEAEQVVFADRFALLYGPHPPLYQWLQHAAFSVFGTGFAALALVKNALLAAIWLSLWQLGLEASGGDRRIAAVASFGLLFSANFAWESQIDHTHTVSVTLMAVLTMLFLLRLARRPTLGTALALGVAIGLGQLAKPNYGVFLAAVLAAFLTLPEGRRAVLSRGFAIAVGLGVLIALPWYAQLWQAPEVGTAKLGNLQMSDDPARRIEGILAFLTAFAGVHGLWVVLIALGWLDRHRPVEGATPRLRERPSARLVLRSWFALVLAFTLLVLAGGTGSFRDHWLQPEAVFAPLVAALWFAHRLDRVAMGRLAVGALALMLLLPAAVAVNKRLHRGAQRDADMPDPVALSRRLADRPGLPLLVLAEARAGFYAPAHLVLQTGRRPDAVATREAELPAGPAWILDGTGAGHGEPVAPFRPDALPRNPLRWVLRERR